MSKSSSAVLPIIFLFAVFTGFLAWQAGFFSFTPTIIAPGTNSMEIRGIDQLTGAKLREKLALTGFMAKGTQTVAIVNEQVVKEQEVLKVDVGRKTFHLLVTAISEERITFSVK